MFASFFIKRPKFAMVISILLTLAGIICAFSLPVEQYPDVAPPTVKVSATYRGAAAEVVANSVAAPLEEVVNGVDGMIYMDSTCTNDGNYELYVNFETGTNPDMALVKVQNRVREAEPQLPSEVKAEGITVKSQFSSQLGFIALISPNGTRSNQFLTDYANGNIKNILKRVPGMGDVQVYGSKYSVRIWLDPERMTALGLSITDVSSAITSQNKQASIGSIGALPGNTDTPLIYSLTTRGRLGTIKEFEDIVVRTTANGEMVKLKDISGIELGGESYNISGRMGMGPAAMMSLMQASGSNAVNVMNAAKKAITQIQKTLPEDTELIIGYDSTEFVTETIKEIIMTLLMTFILVVLVCYAFLQDWRVTLVPIVAIPVSLLATFIGLAALGYSINILSLFGLVLVIGTVVDDAIIVVERVLFIMDRDGCSPEAATVQTMKDVSGPMIATTFVFLAIFVPVAFMGGITGQIYRQFAVTIAFAVVFSLIVAMTLSPAMCALMLRKVHPATKGPLKWFNDKLALTTAKYVKTSYWIARRMALTIFFVVGVIGLSYAISKFLPTSFLPDEDQGAVFASVQLPEGASSPRTKALLDRLVPQIQQIPGVKYVMNISGINIAGGRGENVASIILPLEHWSKRNTAETRLSGVVTNVRKIAATAPEAQINVFTPPAIMGLGMSGGLDMRLQSTKENDPEKLAMVLQNFLVKANQAPEILYAFSSYTSNTPHLYLDIDREKAEMLGVQVGTIFSTLQTYFGSAYINDINIGNQVNKVMVESEWKFRDKITSIGNIFVKGSAGNQVPLQSLASVKKTLAPRSISRYDLFPSAGITIVMKQGYSTGQGIKRVEQLDDDFPDGYKYEWSGMTYQEQNASGQTAVLIAIALVFAYLFLVAQYESWTVPIPVMLFLPIALLGSLVGVYIMGLSISIYVQLGILLLIGLSAKNAILVVEFAKEQHEENGLSIIDAATEALGERFRAVLMTAFTCVAGMIPMLFASGAGAGSRKAVGTSIFFGMIVATVFGVLLIPALYVLFQSAREKISGRHKDAENKE